MTLILLIYNFSSNPHFFFIIQHLSIETLKVFIYKASHIYFRNLIFCCIFFPEFCILFFAENFDFFPRKISNSLVLKSLYFFFRHGKKKIQCFYSLTRIWTKMSQIKKKYGTFRGREKK